MLNEIYNDAYFMKLALRQAQLAFDAGEVPIGAVMASNSVLLCKAHNQVEKLNDTTAHAEILCITGTSEHLGAKFLHDCTLYVTLEPCMMCAGAIKWSRVSRLVIAAADIKEGFISKYQANHVLHPKTEVVWGIEEKESIALLQGFFKKLRN